MSKQELINKIGWIAVAVVVIVVVAVFASVRNQPSTSQSTSITHPSGLESIVSARETWDVAFPAWSGKAAPDFTVTDIHGKSHKLSDYRGKNILVVFWATWCPACKAEIPHLIKLREMYPGDELMILAVSNESREKLKQFAVDNVINYTVSVLGSALPEPFSNVTSIPTTFFIGRNGKIKVTALGIVPLEQAKAIIEAEADPG
jgi:thiol-disulfide isomerase/thioredoxin